MTHTIAVAGGGGFIGGHIVRRLLEDGHDVRAIDVKPVDDWFQRHDAENLQLDLRDASACRKAVSGIDRVLNFAADMGGMGFIELNKAACMLSVVINTNLIEAAHQEGVDRYFFASSACVYPQGRQLDTDVTALAESHAYPADPEDGYGWEKLFGERMCRHAYEDWGLQTRVARFHNIYGPQGCWTGERAKAPAALCRKIAEAKQSGDLEVEIWGDGSQTRSFTYIDDCVEGTVRLIESDVLEPLNIGSSELTSINDLADLIANIAEINIEKRHVLSAPQGVRGRNSDNLRIRELLGWEPSTTLQQGMATTYESIGRLVSAAS